MRLNQENSQTAENTFDVIVIGSGIGGLTSGAILSKLNKKRVLLLEKHFEIGGLTHVFSRGRYKWEVGLHYVGHMKEDMLQRVLFDYITDKRVNCRFVKFRVHRWVRNVVFRLCCTIFQIWFS